MFLCPFLGGDLRAGYGVFICVIAVLWITPPLTNSISAPFRPTAGVHAQHHDHRAEVACGARPAVLQVGRPQQDDEAEEDAEDRAAVRQVQPAKLVASQQAQGVGYTRTIYLLAMFGSAKEGAGIKATSSCFAGFRAGGGMGEIRVAQGLS